MKKSLSILTVLGKDRPGIIANVTEILFHHGCNLEDISMTTLEGELAMIVVICLDKKSRFQIDDRLERLGEKESLDFFWKDIGRSFSKKQIFPKTKTFLISAIGSDRTGIVYKISRVLAGFGINITDLNSRILGKGSKALYAMVLQADIPPKVQPSKIERVLQQLARSLRIEINLRPFERIEF
jgi:glycine cleavage system transcriptional repressor